MLLDNLHAVPSLRTSKLNQLLQRHNDALPHASLVTTSSDSWTFPLPVDLITCRLQVAEQSVDEQRNLIANMLHSAPNSVEVEACLGKIQVSHAHDFIWGCGYIYVHFDRLPLVQFSMHLALCRDMVETSEIKFVRFVKLSWSVPSTRVSSFPVEIMSLHDVFGIATGQSVHQGVCLQPFHRVTGVPRLEAVRRCATNHGCAYAAHNAGASSEGVL